MSNKTAKRARFYWLQRIKRSEPIFVSYQNATDYVLANGGGWIQLTLKGCRIIDPRRLYKR